MSPRACTFMAAAVMATLSACGRRTPVAPPPPVFPAATAWTAVLAEGVEHAAFGGGRLLVLTRDGTLRGLDPETGAGAWETAQAKGVLSVGPSLGILRAHDGRVHAFDPESGTGLWRADAGVPGSVPALVGSTRVVVAGEEGVAALDLESGAPVWQQPSAPVRAAALEGEILLLAEEDGTLRRRDATGGRSLWALPAGAVQAAPPTIDAARGHAYLGAAPRGFVAVDLEDGSFEWRWRMAAGVPTAPVLLGRRVLFAALDDVLWALDGGGGSMAWRAELPSRPVTGPLLVGSAVLVACHGARPDRGLILAFDGRTGAPLGSLATPAPVQPPLVAAQGRLYLALRDRRILAVTLRGA